jgi:hypothetical protein
MNKTLLVKAASLCREAANKLKTASAFEADGIVDSLVSKGMVPDTERERYTQYLMENPEKLAAARGVVDSLPARSGAIGEVSSSMSSGGIDAMDTFIYQ